MQNSVTFYQRLFCKSLLCLVFPCTEKSVYWRLQTILPESIAFCRLRSLVVLSHGAVGKPKQCSSINRLCLPGLAATASERVRRQYASVYSHRHTTLLCTASKSVIFLFCSGQIPILLGWGHTHKLLFQPLGPINILALRMFTLERAMLWD